MQCAIQLLQEKTKLKLSVWLRLQLLTVDGCGLGGQEGKLKDRETKVKKAERRVEYTQGRETEN